MALVHLATLEAGLSRWRDAEELAERARQLAVDHVDVPGYLLAVVVLSQVFQGSGDDLNCLAVLFRGSNGLADLVGEVGRQPFQEMLDTLKRSWGEPRYTRSLTRYIEQRRAAAAAS
jgi:hypothetical protein